MRTLTVKAKKGRVARESPRGPFIPDDRFVKVPDTPYVRRLLNVHGDIEEEIQSPAAPTTEAKTKPKGLPATPPPAPVNTEGK